MAGSGVAGLFPVWPQTQSFTEAARRQQRGIESKGK
jgi:hypothetical protein